MNPLDLLQRGDVIALAMIVAFWAAVLIFDWIDHGYLRASGRTERGRGSPLPGPNRGHR